MTNRYTITNEWLGKQVDSGFNYNRLQHLLSKIFVWFYIQGNVLIYVTFFHFS